MWELRTWNVEQIFEIKLCMVGQYHSRWLFTKTNCSKNLQFKNRSLSCHCWSLTWLSNMVVIDSESWLLLIQNHARHSFQAFAHSHLKLLCWLIGIWAETQLAFHLLLIGLQNLVAIDSESYQTSFPSFCAPPCEVTVLIDWNLSRRPFFWVVEVLTDHWIRSAALHRIQFRTCGFVPMSYFDSETNEWSQDWAKRWALLWSATTSCQFHPNFITHEQKSVVTARYLQSIKTFLTLELSQYLKSGSTFSSSLTLAEVHFLCWKLRGKQIN